ncbi:type VI secretion protein [Mesorhizobium sp. L-8-10]|uniref:type VI secretion system membrane subunit TssM n=1 Tax=Mesorhizobium sp. L-8-10 TaxID=2744523 RepID=UPI0019268642|nr:type VI secretion system membrane subunit TssM [Mesorhizobium sp. L-8-10]BCH33447.1 type VI secretion protein [Mesorhizobium sp. L-8-10]
MRSWIVGSISAIALACFAAAVWYAGPMIGFNGERPFEPVWVRAAIVAAAFLLAGAWGVLMLLRRSATHPPHVAEADVATGDPELLKRMNEALGAPRSSKRKIADKQPWYLVIGRQDAGKTAAIANWGLRPDASRSAREAATQQCDWWLAEEAVFIDTPGRLTMQDSNSATDRKSWLALLSLLGKSRAGQPIDGVIVVISLKDVIALESEALAAQAHAIRNRLQEIQDRLTTEFGVYLLFSMADLVPGFAEFFGRFDDSRRGKVWGAMFQPQDREERTAGSRVGKEFDALVQRLSQETTDRLYHEPDPIARIAIFGFPLQFASLKQRIVDLAGRMFEPAAYRAVPKLHGFYFSSARQTGAAAEYTGSAHGVDFFLRDLLTKVIPAETGWKSRDRPALRPAALLRYGGLAAFVLGAATLIGAWGVSFVRNRALVDSTQALIRQVHVGNNSPLGSTEVTGVDLENIVETLALLRDLPAGYDSGETSTPLQERFGLSQRAKLNSASKEAYRQALERLLRSRLVLQVESAIRTKLAEPIELYEPLKVYLMLGGQAPRIDDELIIAWIKQDWEQNRYPGPANREGRDELERHLRAMLDLDDGRGPTYELDRSLVETAQRSLSRMDMADLARALVNSAIHSAGLDDFSVAARAGPQSPLVFEARDGRGIAALRVPGIYTWSGFNEFFLPQLATVAQKVVDDQWVMGAGGAQVGVEEQLDRLGPELLERYGRDFLATWTKLLDNLKLRPMTEDKPDYASLSAASSPTSPITQLVEAVADETALTRDLRAGEDTEPAPGAMESMAKGLARIGVDLPSGKSQSRAGGAFKRPTNQIPGANIEAHFKPFQILVDGNPGGRPIDALIQNFHNVLRSLVMATNSPAQAERANANLQLQVHNLRANASRLPKQLASMVNAAADDFEGDVARTSIAQLNKLLAEAVTEPCNRLVTNAYPFARRSDRDASLTDFARLFAPGGVIDRFFAQNLAPLADLSGRDWQWRQDSRLGRELSKSTLKAFQRAAEIRDAFFPQGGSAPGVSITFTPFSLHVDADMALLDVNGQIVQSHQTGSVPSTFNWPASTSSGGAGLSLTPEIPGREFAVHFDGPWALMRLLDGAASLSPSDNGLEARFLIGGRDVAYTIRAGSGVNPLVLPALSEFSCPDQL